MTAVLERKERNEKTTVFGVKLVRSLVIYQAAQIAVLLMHVEHEMVAAPQHECR